MKFVIDLSGFLNVNVVRTPLLMSVIVYFSWIYIDIGVFSMFWKKKSLIVVSF